MFLKDNKTHKKNISLKKQTKEAFFTGIKNPTIWLTGSLECVVYLGFFASKTFLPLYSLEVGISLIWVGIFFSF